MNKAELVETLLKDKDAGFDSKASAEKAVNALIHAIVGGLKRDKNVQLIGLGNFVVRKRKEREGRNPKTGEVIHIAASKTVAFRPSKTLKTEI